MFDAESPTVLEIVASYLEENEYDGLVMGRCSCRLDDLMKCGMVNCHRCSAARLMPCDHCAKFTTCDLIDGSGRLTTSVPACPEFEPESE